MPPPRARLRQAGRAGGVALGSDTWVSATFRGIFPEDGDAIGRVIWLGWHVAGDPDRPPSQKARGKRQRRSPHAWPTGDPAHAGMHPEPPKKDSTAGVTGTLRRPTHAVARLPRLDAPAAAFGPCLADLSQHRGEVAARLRERAKPGPRGVRALHDRKCRAGRPITLGRCQVLASRSPGKRPVAPRMPTAGRGTRTHRGNRFRHGQESLPRHPREADPARPHRLVRFIPAFGGRVWPRLEPRQPLETLDPQRPSPPPRPRHQHVPAGCRVAHDSPMQIGLVPSGTVAAAPSITSVAAICPERILRSDILGRRQHGAREPCSPPFPQSAAQSARPRPPIRIASGAGGRASSPCSAGMRTIGGSAPRTRTNGALPRAAPAGSEARPVTMHATPCALCCRLSKGSRSPAAACATGHAMSTR